MANIDRTDNQYANHFLCWGRGDTDAKTITLFDGSGQPIDVSGWTLEIVVNTTEDTKATATEIFTSAATFATDGTDGKILVAPSAGDLDSVDVGQAFYALRRLTPTVRTLFISRVEFI